MYIFVHPPKDITLNAALVSNKKYQSLRLFSVPDPIDKAVFSEAEISQWVSDKLHHAFDINRYTGVWRVVGAKSEPSDPIKSIFTVSGLRSYELALEQDQMYSKLMGATSGGSGVMSLSFLGQAPRIIAMGVLQNKLKQYYWRMDVPVRISISQAGTTIESSNTYNVSLTVVREPASIRSARLAIDKIRLTRTS